MNLRPRLQALLLLVRLLLAWEALALLPLSPAALTRRLLVRDGVTPQEAAAEVAAKAAAGGTRVVGAGATAAAAAAAAGVEAGAGAGPANATTRIVTTARGAELIRRRVATAMQMSVRGTGIGIDGHDGVAAAAAAVVEADMPHGAIGRETVAEEKAAEAGAAAATAIGTVVAIAIAIVIVIVIVIVSTAASVTVAETAGVTATATVTVRGERMSSAMIILLAAVARGRANGAGTTVAIDGNLDRRAHGQRLGPGPGLGLGLGRGLMIGIMTAAALCAAADARRPAVRVQPQAKSLLQQCLRQLPPQQRLHRLTMPVLLLLHQQLLQHCARAMVSLTPCAVPPLRKHRHRHQQQLGRWARLSRWWPSAWPRCRP